MPFITRYSTITNGAMTFTGNTLGLSQLINVNQAGTQGSIGAFVTLSGTQVPTFPIGTTLDYLDNSSEAILNIPPGSTILYAELIWGGNYLSGSQDISGLINDSITFTTPLGSNIIAPDPATANQPTFVVVTTTIGFYMRSAEVTGLVQAAGSGTYSAGGVPGLLDPAFASTFDSNNAGWTLAVVYGNPSLPARDMNLFVGAEIIQGSTSVDIPVSGFVTPALGAVAGRILLSAQEGDANIAGDQTLFGPTVGSLGILSGPNNPATNFYGSQINNDSGNLDTTGTFGDRNQDPFTLTNIVAGRQGWDITNVDATPYLINNQTDAVLRLNTSGDAYMPNTIGIQIDVSAPNLQPVKSVDKDFAAVGDTLTYTVVIPNNSLVDANNVIFTDIEPPDTAFVPGSFTLNGVPVLGADPNLGVNIGTVPTGGSATVTFQVIIQALPIPNPIVNQAVLNYEYQSSVGGPILSGSANTNQVTTQVNSAELTMVKSVDQAFATIGDTLTYTTVITNTGDVLASNVFFEDIPPAGSLFVPNSVTVNAVAQPGVDPGVGFNIGDLAAGATVTVTFQVIVNSLPVPAQLINTATATFQYQIDPGQPPVTETASSNPVTTQVNVAAVSVVKSVDQATAITGDILTYTTVITNNGNIPLLNVIFTDTPPAGSSFVPGSVTVNGVPQLLLNPSPPGFSIGDIPSGAAVTVTFQVLVTVVPVPPTLPELINTSTIDYQYEIDPNLPPLNGTMTSNPVITEIILGELGVVKSVDQAFATVGDTLTYTSVITNQGNVEASDIFFLDAPPLGTAFVPGSVTINGVPQAGLDPALGFSIPAGPPNDVLAPSGVVTVTFQVTISSLPVPPLLTNQSLVNYRFGESPIIVTAPSNPVTTQVNVSAVNVLKSVDQATAITGDTLTYTTVITNNGNIPLQNVIFTDTPPAGTSFVSGSVTVNGVSQPLVNPTPPGFSVGDIAVGATVTVVFQVLVTVVPVPPALPVLTNTSTIDYQYQIDPNLPPLNGTMTSNPVVTEVILGELGIVKSVDQGFATVGDTLTYTSVITNQGNVEANNIFFFDAPPAGTAFVPGSVTINGVPQAGLDPTLGFSIPAAPPNDVLPPGGAVTVGFQVTISALPVPPQVTNNSLVEYQFGESPVIVTAVSNPATTQVNVTLLNMVKSVDKVTAITGEILTYTTVISNTGNVPLLNVLFTDTPPAGTSFVSGSVTVN
ncbi:DUF11 domain-containing protein, partial [Desulfosporosinus shakirovi]|uniref:DUF11 domain-containing protein n=1 Tax=Desulfosporosinus shakirovi TaxID=2885154 RepID=UPI001E40D6FB